MTSPTVESNAVAARTPQCPRCGYNLTGLTTARCPECGQAFAWRDVWDDAARTPRIAFERSGGWRKVPALFLTALCVIFLPWVFARQIVRQVSAPHGLVFGCVCLVWTFLAVLSNADIAFLLAWISTALIYILLQTMALTAVDVANWDRLLAATRFWLLTGCYTSAIILTEICYGPPLLALSDLRDVLFGRLPNSLLRSMFELDEQSSVWWVQLLLWLFVLGCIYYRRLRSRYWLRVLVLPATLLTTIGLMILYAAVIEHIGFPLGEWYYDLLE